MKLRPSSAQITSRAALGVRRKTITALTTAIAKGSHNRMRAERWLGSAAKLDFLEAVRFVANRCFPKWVGWWHGS